MSRNDVIITVLLLGMIFLLALATLHDAEYRRTHPHQQKQHQDKDDDTDIMIIPNSDGSISVYPF